MKRQLGCLSPLGLLAALVGVLALAGYTWSEGGVLFSPGPATAAHGSDSPLSGFSSHAEFESQCQRCHSPWQGADAKRCLACHTTVQDEIFRQDGLHGRLHSPGECIMCHTEHLGQEADISAATRADYPHQLVGFSLARHQRWPGRPFSCSDCHEAGDYSFDPDLCQSCHANLDGAFVSQHAAQYAGDCLGCHDGSGAMTEFDHNLRFPLDGGHGDLQCHVCHVNGQYRQLPSDCVACHDEPEVHRAQFGTDCRSCHSADAWVPASLQHHTFPLDHGGASEAGCQACHPDAFNTYTCFGCHEHDRPEVEREHQQEGLSNLEDCADCHPGSRTNETALSELGDD